MMAGIIASLAKLVAGCTSEWIVEPDARQRVYVANHTSHLDFVVLWASLPPRTRTVTVPVAAADYWSTGWRYYVASKVFHAVLIDRAAAQGASQDTPHDAPHDAPHDSSQDGSHGVSGEELGKRAVDRMLTAMGHDHSLILFPEGTRGTGGNIGEFKSGLYYLCEARPGLEVMPVYLANLNRILPKGEMLPVPLLSSARFGRPLHLDPGETKWAFLTRVRAAVITLAEA